MTQSHREQVNLRSKAGKIQNNVKRLGKWVDKWLMESALEKFKVGRLTQLPGVPHTGISSYLWLLEHL